MKTKTPVTPEPKTPLLSAKPANSKKAVGKSKTKSKKSKYDIATSNLNPEQELFCKTFASPSEFFGNGLQSYALAYKIDLSTKGNVNTAKANAYRLLTKAYITKRITGLIDESGLNDINVDKQLLIAVQQCADFSSKVAAIREYNKLRKRVADRVEHSGPEGEAIEVKSNIPVKDLAALAAAIVRAKVEVDESK